MTLALGAMGLSFLDYAALTPFMFELKCKGYADARLVEEVNLRNLAWITVSPHIDFKKNNLSPSDIWPIKGVDKNRKRTVISKQRISSLLEQFKKNKK